MTDRDDDSYVCRSREELVELGKKLNHPKRLSFRLIGSRLPIKDILCEGVPLDDVRRIFSDAQSYIEKYRSVIRFPDILIDSILMTLNLAFITSFATKIEQVEEALRKKYSFSERLSDRSCIARLYMCGWRVHEVGKGGKFVLRHDARAFKAGFF